MKFTSQDLIKAMGLSVGDKVKVTFKDDTIEEYEIIKHDNGNVILHDDFYGYDDHIGHLLDQEIEILPRPKRVGDLKCNNECFRNNGQCPIRAICSHCNLMRSDKTLYEFLEFYKDKKDKYANEVEFDQEIYDLLKARLDKEVKEHESNTN